jgi:hypothetical protein
MSNEMDEVAAKPEVKKEKLDDPAPASGKTRVSNSEDTPTIGAVAVPGIQAGRVSSFNSDGDHFSYTNRSVEGSSEARDTRASENAASNQDEPIEATRVVDDEADIEAQVHTRMQNQARDIAQLVHQELMTHVAIPVDVQSSSVQDAASITTKDQKDQGVEEELQKKKKICIIVIVFLVIVAAIGIGVGVAASNKDPKPEESSQPPTAAPTPVTTRAQAFKGILEPISGEQLNNTNSPQFQALNWLANVDAANMTVGVDSEDMITSRYVAAVLYYAFGGSDWLNQYKFLSDREACSWNQKFIDGVRGMSCGSDGTVELFQLREYTVHIE